MKKIKLTQGKYALVDNEDYEYLNQWKWWFNLSNSNRYGYARRVKTPNKKRYLWLMHRLIIGAKKDQIVDHINRNGLDNRKKNLRIVSKSQNVWNSSKNKISTSKYKGASLLRKGALIRWQARITYNKKRIFLGSFKNQKDAFKAYKKASLKYHGEFSPWKK